MIEYRLNLVHPERSSFKFKIIKYPDGQQDIRIENKDFGREFTGPIGINARLNSFSDLEILICAVKAFRRMAPAVRIWLHLPYLLGTRSDRIFEYGSPDYFPDVVAPILRSLDCETIVTLDPHSSVTEAVLPNLLSMPPIPLLTHFAKHYTLLTGKTTDKDVVIVCPDDGAVKRADEAADVLKCVSSVLRCSKHRDPKTGEITETVVPYNGDYANQDFVIVDDICDGGRTFIEIAKALKKQIKRHGWKSKVFLVVTHGVFSKGFDELEKVLDGIYCTNSVRGMDYSLVEQLNVF